MSYQRGSNFNKKPLSLSKKVLFGAIIILIAATFAFLIAQNVQTKKEINSLKKKNSSAKNDAYSDLVSKVGKITELPNEEPTIATVRNIKELATEPFFKDAKNGDKVLIYTKSKKAIIYRPSSSKIIQSGPINFNSDQAVENSNTAASTN